MLLELRRRRPPQVHGRALYLFVVAATAWFPAFTPPFGFHPEPWGAGSKILLGVGLGEWDFQADCDDEEAIFMQNLATRRSSAQKFYGCIFYRVT